MHFIRRLGGGFPRPSDDIEEGSGVPTFATPAPIPPAPVNPLSFGMPEDRETPSAHPDQGPVVHSSRIDAASFMDVDVNTARGTQLLPSVKIRSRREGTAEAEASQKIRVIEKADPRIMVCTLK